MFTAWLICLERLEAEFGGCAPPCHASCSVDHSAGRGLRARGAGPASRGAGSRALVLSVVPSESLTTQPCPGASAVPARWPPVSGADRTSAEWRRTWQVRRVRQRPTRGRRLPRGERAARSHLVTVSKRAQTSGRHPRRSERCPREAWSVTSWRVTSVITRRGRFPQRALLWGPCGAPLWSSGRLGLGISERTSSIRTLTAVGVVTATPGAARCSERCP